MHPYNEPAFTPRTDACELCWGKPLSVSHTPRGRRLDLLAYTMAARRRNGIGEVASVALIGFGVVAICVSPYGMVAVAVALEILRAAMLSWLTRLALLWGAI